MVSNVNSDAGGKAQEEESTVESCLLSTENVSKHSQEVSDHLKSLASTI